MCECIVFRLIDGSLMRMLVLLKRDGALAISVTSAYDTLDSSAKTTLRTILRDTARTQRNEHKINGRRYYCDCQIAAAYERLRKNDELVERLNNPRLK